MVLIKKTMSIKRQTNLYYIWRKNYEGFCPNPKVLGYLSVFLSCKHIVKSKNRYNSTVNHCKLLKSFVKLSTTNRSKL